MAVRPPQLPAIEEIRRLLEAGRTEAYGERVSQLEHALQSATLAERAHADAGLVAAALLHDVGHLLHRDADGALRSNRDDAHERIGVRYLARWFGPRVCEPIALHVLAKRFLCAREAGYDARLSTASRRTLQLQGGPLTADEAARFERLDHADDA